MTLKHIWKGTKWDVPCERCSNPLSECACPPPPPPAAPGAKAVSASAQRVVVRLEKRPGGKKVTVLSGLEAKDRDELLPRFKSLCGAGGTIKDGKLEVQGEHREKLVTELERLGYAARKG